MNEAPAPTKTQGASDTQTVLGLNCPTHAASAATVFRGPSNPRQARVLAELMAGARLTNNSVRSIGGVLNGPDIIAGLRSQGLCAETELVMTWIKTIDRDGRHVRYGEYHLTPKGIAKVRAWEASQRAAVVA